MIKPSEEKLHLKAATTRFPTPILPTHLSDEEKVEAISQHFKEIMTLLGLDLSDPSLQKTPERVANMYVREVFQGISLDAFPAISFFNEEMSKTEYQGVVVTKCGFTSFCEHHFVPMIGAAYIGYIPHGKVIGLSKISRIVRYFAARPQLQERLSAQIADCLGTLLGHEDIAVSIQAQHTCVIARGTKDESGFTTTAYLRGAFLNNSEMKRDFYTLIDQMIEQEKKK